VSALVTFPETSIRAIANLTALHLVDCGFDGKYQFSRIIPGINAVAGDQELVPELKLSNKAVQFCLISRESAGFVTDDAVKVPPIQTFEHGLVLRPRIVIAGLTLILERGSDFKALSGSQGLAVRNLACDACPILQVG
jgi:hypothetical protein